MFNLLCNTLTPEWISKSFPVIKFILLILIVLACIGLIVVVLMQQTDNESGGNAITGIKDTYYSQNKGATRDGRLKKLTVILSIFVAVAIVVFFVLSEIYPGSLWTAAA